MNKYLIGSIAITAIVTLFSFRSGNKINIQGSWKIAEVQTVKSDGSVASSFPTESQVVFTDKFYSFCWTSHNSTTHSWQMADSVKLARLNQSIINAGTYELKDVTITTKATFAMNPMFVNGEAKFKCSYNGDTLVLTGLSVNSSDNIPNPVYVAGSHIVNKLVRLK